MIGFVPENDYIYISEEGVVDSWGINTVTSRTKKKIGCLIRTADSSAPITALGGKQIIPSYAISINGKNPICVGTYIEVNGERKVVLTKKESKDLAGKVMLTKITV